MTSIGTPARPVREKAHESVVGIKRKEKQKTLLSRVSEKTKNLLVWKSINNEEKRTVF